MNESYLPSKSIVWLGVISVIILIGVAAVKYMPFSQAAESEGDLVTLSENDRAAMKDTDNDGLADWEEALWKTDPNLADTDGDGVPDGEEVEQKRNPAVAGPNDALTQAQIDAGYAIDATSTDRAALPDGRPNTTEQRFQDILPEIVRLTQEGEYTQAELNAIAQRLAAAQIPRKEPYTIDEITQTGDTTENIRRYTQALQEIIVPYEGSGVGDELDIMARAMQSGDRRQMKRLGDVSDKYMQITEKLAGMSVPSALVSPHLQLVNSYQGMAEGIDNMQYFYEDPLRARAGINMYREASQSATEAQDAITREVDGSF